VGPAWGEGGGGVTAARGAREGSGGGAAGPPRAQSGGGGKGGELGRRPGWAERGGREGREEKKRFFLFKIYFLDECFHSFTQSKQMHGSA
jgi:hypothetical protein